MSLNCLLKIYICEYFISFFLILVSIVFDNEPPTVAVAKAVGIEYGKLIHVIATNFDAAVVAIDDNTISVISAMLI